MNSKTEQSNTAASPGDMARYALAVLLALGGMVGFYWFSDWPGPLRGLLPVLGFVAAMAVAAFTPLGLQAREFISEARFELRKVVWPTRDETVKGTLLIIVVVIIISLLLALFDFFIQAGVTRLLG